MVGRPFLSVKTGTGGFSAGLDCQIYQFAGADG
jgi:hypothetical protein